jgi:hypothetical protein
MNMQGLAQHSHRDGRGGARHFSPQQLVSSRTTSHARCARQTSMARHHCIPRSLPAWIYLQRGAISATLTAFASGHVPQAARTRACAKRTTILKCNIELSEFINPRTDSMRPYMSRILRQYILGALIMSLFSQHGHQAPKVRKAVQSNGNLNFREAIVSSTRRLPRQDGTISHMARQSKHDKSFMSTAIHVIRQQLLQGPWPRPGLARGPRRASSKAIRSVTCDTHNYAHPCTTAIPSYTSRAHARRGTA